MPGQQWFLLLFSLDRKFVPLTMKPLVFCEIKKIMLGFATIWTLFSCFFHLNSHERGQDTLNRSSQFHGQLNHPPSCKKNFHWWFIFCCLAAISYPNKSKEWILNELFARYKQLCQSLFSRKLESSWICSWDELQSTPTPSLRDVLWSFLLWGDKTQRGSVAAIAWDTTTLQDSQEKKCKFSPWIMKSGEEDSPQLLGWAFFQYQCVFLTKV